MPHCPQCVALWVMSTQEPAQLVLPLEQLEEHAPWSQTALVAQLLSQAPQRLGSLETSTHTPEQSRKPGWQASTQVPRAQVAMPPGGVGHSLPQAPQFATSAARSRQAEPQGTKPSRQTKAHCESMHTALPYAGAVHCVPHDRQFPGSRATSTHLSPHLVSPSAHRTAPGGEPPLPAGEPGRTQTFVDTSQT